MTILLQADTTVIPTVQVDPRAAKRKKVDEEVRVPQDPGLDHVNDLHGEADIEAEQSVAGPVRMKMGVDDHRKRAIADRGLDRDRLKGIKSNGVTK